MQYEQPASFSWYSTVIVWRPNHVVHDVSAALAHRPQVCLGLTFRMHSLDRPSCVRVCEMKKLRPELRTLNFIFSIISDISLPLRCSFSLTTRFDAQSDDYSPAPNAKCFPALLFTIRFIIRMPEPQLSELMHRQLCCKSICTVKNYCSEIKKIGWRWIESAWNLINGMR